MIVIIIVTEYCFSCLGNEALVRSIAEVAVRVRAAVRTWAAARTWAVVRAWAAVRTWMAVNETLKCYNQNQTNIRSHWFSFLSPCSSFKYFPETRIICYIVSWFLLLVCVATHHRVEGCNASHTQTLKHHTFTSCHFLQHNTKASGTPPYIVMRWFNEYFDAVFRNAVEIVILDSIRCKIA